ncbi:hypothetical protein, partial [Burkholderia multivorans]|uniref:hypothetical protein n=1 Tax=Burkholderia multivorans TaxID=87883 RepID=UPI003736F769
MIDHQANARFALGKPDKMRALVNLNFPGPSSFRVEHNTHNDSWSSSPVGMCAGRWSACAHVHRAGLSRR